MDHWPYNNDREKPKISVKNMQLDHPRPHMDEPGIEPGLAQFLPQSSQNKECDL
jgi:hypothetical protein